MNRYDLLKTAMESDEMILKKRLSVKCLAYCTQNEINQSVYFEILDQHKLFTKHWPHINVEVRKKAGFACEEIKKPVAKKCL